MPAGTSTASCLILWKPMVFRHCCLRWMQQVSTPVLNQNRVVVFAPTNDVFEETALALGCSDALDLATRLINTPVGDTNALVSILTYHAYLGRIRTGGALIKRGTVHTVNGADVTTGVNKNGIFVQGVANATASTVTTAPINGFRFTVFPVNQILLPFAPPADLCS